MTRIELLNRINKYFLNPTEDVKQDLIDLMNELIEKKEVNNYLDIFFMCISITQMYGFLQYLDEDTRNRFIEDDYLTTASYLGKNISFYNSGQLSLLNEIDSSKKSFISAPTSFGKTTIVTEYVLHNIEKMKNVIYIVPTNSLLEELFVKFTKIFSKNKDIYISTQPISIDNKRNFLLLTPERFLMYFENNNLQNVDLLLMDETYQIMKKNQNKVSDFINERDARFRKVADIIAKNGKKVIFLSPFTYEVSESMSRFLYKFDIKKIDRKIEYVSHEIIEIYNVNQSKDLNLTQKIYKEDSIVSKTVKLLVDLKREKNIIYVKGYSLAYEISEAFESEDVISNDRFKSFYDHLINNYTIDNNLKWKIISALEKGIGIYISPMPRYIKKEIINLFEENLLHTLIVTTAFTEGVNTSAKNLIFTSLINGNNSNKLTPIDILNVAGRAGRFGKNSIGKIYCIDQKVYKEIIKIRNESSIKIENPNYKIENDFENTERNDYEIEMIEDEYLNSNEIDRIQETFYLMNELKLTQKDLDISLNVSNKWKLFLYRWFVNDWNKTDEIYYVIKNLVNDLEKVKSLEYIFDIIKFCLEAEGINPFPTEVFDVSAYDKSGKFIWGRLYKFYVSGKIIDSIRKNRQYIESEYNRIISNKNLRDKSKIKKIFYDEGYLWMLNKYYKEDCINQKTDAFYTEAFKFISSIVQYKIPYYVSFFISIFKLFIVKNDLKYDISEFDLYKISLNFENGIIASEEYRILLDFGFSRDLVNKIMDNKIPIQSIINDTFDKSIFDEYEIIILKEFAVLNI